MWIYQAVTNVGIQVLVLMGLGYIFARCKFLEQAKFLPQSNFIVLMLALPAFNLYLMGIKLDLQSPEPWKSLAAFLLWVFVVQACILVYVWRFCGGDAGEAAVVNMVLLMDNYAITGLLALNATLGTKWGTLALLMAMGFFLVIFPFSLAAFEWEKWAVQQHVEAVAEAAAFDIEAATATAAAAEAADGFADGKQTLDGSVVSEQPMLASTDTNPQVPHGTGNGRAAGGRTAADLNRLEMVVYPGTGRSASPAASTGVELSAGPAQVAGSCSGALGPAAPQGGEAQTTDGFPHESRYCWWSNEEYRPAHPLLGDGVLSSSQAVQSTGAHEQRQRRRRQEQLQEPLRQQQARTGTYVPPLLLPPSGRTPDLDGTAAVVSPFQATSAVGWPTEFPAPPSAVRHAVAVNDPPSGSQSRSVAQSPRRGAADRSLLASMFDRLAAASSGQLPPTVFGDLARTPTAEPEKPVRLLDLEFALTHKLSAGTASQLARLSRGYTAAAAAATAAAASPDANLRRMLLAAAGPGARPRLPLSGSASRQGSEPLAPSSAAACPTAVTGAVPATPTKAVSRPRDKTLPPSSASNQAVHSGSALVPLQHQLGPLGAAAVGAVPQSTLPLALASLESADSIDTPMGGVPAMPKSTNDYAASAAHEATAEHAALVCPTLIRQEAISNAVPSPPESPQPRSPAVNGQERLASTSMPVFSFHRRSQRRIENAVTATGVITPTTDGVSGAPESPVMVRRGAVQRSASDTGHVDKMLLTLASGLALDGAKRRTVSRRVGGDGSTPLLVDTGPNVLLQLADAVSAYELAGQTAADKQLVREATREALRRHGGLAGAFAAFVSGHPQLWHIVSTLSRNPMIWTMFIAMAVSVSGLRVFLDPASPKYRPEVGWVAGSLSWIYGLVVPMSIFSNGAWMYGKPLLPKGELVKTLVLLLIKVGALPLLMAACALLVRLDGQHVAAMTVLTLSPAAAASFVLAVQYDRGVELVSLTNILGNIFLTPLLIMWLKILAALQIEFRLHEDA